MDYFELKTVRDALALLAQYGEQAKVIAGGTDVIVDIKYKEEPGCLVNIKKIPALSHEQVTHSIELFGTKVMPALGS